MRALGSCVERVDRLTAGHEEPVPPSADETQVGSAFGHQNLTELGAVGRIDVDAVDPFTAEAGSAPEISLDVGADAVVKARVERRELAPLGQTGSVALDGPRDDLRLLTGEVR